MPDISGYSTTPASNANVGSFVAAEGMAARLVNDSMRQYAADVRGAFEGPDSKLNGLEWFNAGHVPTRTGNTTFTIPSDLTAVYVEGRRLRLTDSTTLYATVVSSAFGAVTTVTVSVDGGTALSASLTKVYLSPQMPTSVSAPAIFGKNDYATTGGSSSAYTLTFNPKLPALNNGARVRAKLHTACAATPTLAVDATTAKTIVLPGNAPVAANDLPANVALAFVYDITLDRWVVEGLAGLVTSSVLATIHAAIRAA